MLSAVDTAIGRILQALQDQQQLDQSLILFSSDNGGPNPGVLTRNGRFRAGKGTLYEGGIRSAACVTWPGKIPAGVRKDAPVHIIDWFPTLLEVAGGSLAQPLPLDGKSLIPFLTLDQPTPHESLLLVQSPERAAIRAGDWKLLQLTESAAADAAPSGKRGGAAAKKSNRRQAPQPTGNSELYNLSSDPEERQNVANEHPDVVRRLKTQLDEYLKDAVPPGQPG
jgi:arylsulfatase A-like enzyme